MGRINSRCKWCEDDVVLLRGEYERRRGVNMVDVAMPFRCPISIIACGSYHTAVVNGVKSTSFCEGVNDVDVVLFRVKMSNVVG